MRNERMKPEERLRNAKVEGVRVVLGDGSLLLELTFQSSGTSSLEMMFVLLDRGG